MRADTQQHCLRYESANRPNRATWELDPAGVLTWSVVPHTSPPRSSVEPLLLVPLGLGGVDSVVSRVEVAPLKVAPQCPAVARETQRPIAILPIGCNVTITDRSVIWDNCRFYTQTSSSVISSNNIISKHRAR